MPPSASTSPTARWVTCVVFERLGRQIHFIDGNDGGYARAARALKERLWSGMTTA